MPSQRLTKEANFESVICPRKIMADRENQEFELLNFFKRIVKKVCVCVCVRACVCVCQTDRQTDRRHDSDVFQVFD